MSTAAGKTCVVCGKWYPQSVFEYGGRINNSYCGICKAEYARIYAKEKSAGTRRWLAEMRLKR
jgi:hypothetical protein